MTNATEAQTTTSREAVVLDPFSFWPRSASRIAGLGGPDVDADPAYVFHTAYAPVGSGVVRCVLKFDGLTAELGQVVVRVNAIDGSQDARATTIKTWTINLNEVVAARGRITMKFEVPLGMQCAVLGHCYGELVAQANGLRIELQATGETNGFEDRLAVARKSIFGRRLFRRANRMLSDDRATLADPVSQTCTANQFDEPAYAEWLQRLHLPMHRHRKQWEFIYILQTLERYGMLTPGARGIGFGVGIEPLPAAMAAMGVEVVASDLADDDERARDWSVTNQHANSIEQLRYPAICPDDLFDRNVAFRTIDMNAIDPDLEDFDFTWSSCSLEHLGSIDAGLDFIVNSVNCLKRGGLAVHTTELNLTSNTNTLESGGTVLFRRRDIERLAVDLASRGHLVAQIKYDLGNTQQDAYVDVPPYSNDNHLKLALGKYVTTSFGIIVRRGDR